MEHMYWVLFPSVLAILSACSGEAPVQEDDEFAVGASPSALRGDNSLGSNALNLNALNLNGLNVKTLNVDTMTSASLSTIQDPGGQGPLARQLLKYAVSCALGPTQSFSFSWNGELGVVYYETYWGLLSLAPDWPSRQLTTQEAEWVSACLVARVNWYGVPVMISARGPHSALGAASTDELTYWTKEEGVFWGNLFGSSPYAFSCYSVVNRDYARSQLRDCAAGHLDSQNSLQNCGIIQIVGPCSAYCTPSKAGDYYEDCSSTMGGNPSSAVVTVFLR